MTQQANGIGDTIDFDRLYRWLDRTVVSLPSTEDGEPISPRDVARYLLKVQDAREKLDRTLVQLERRIGSCDRQIAIAKEKLRLADAAAKSDAFVVSLPVASRERAVLKHTSGPAAALAEARLAKIEVEAALRAVDAHVKTMETAKQTLNAIRRMSEDDPLYNRPERRPRS